MRSSLSYSEPLQAAWLDIYGHMNTAYYQVPFSNAIWAYQSEFGLGREYFEATGGSLYTVESHARYVREVRGMVDIEVETFTVECDEKRLHLAQVMTVDGVERATFECMSLHVDSRSGKASPMPAEVFAAFQRVCVARENWPDWVGRRIALAR